MNALLQRLFAAMYDPCMAAVERNGLGDLRAALLGGLSGTVVEIGAGTGANLDHYGPGVDRVTAVEPSPPMAERFRTRAREHPLDAAVVVAPAEQLPLPDASADAVVTTLVLCSVRDVSAAVSEARRVLKPGGRLVLLEHVAAEGRLRRIQRLVEPIYTPLAGGCRLTRDPTAALQRAGFDVAGMRRTELPMPALAGSGLVGTALAN